MSGMSTLDFLEQRMLSAAMGLRNDMIAAGTAGFILPVDEIKVAQTADGVTVKFVQPSAQKVAKPARQAQTAPRVVDES